MTRKQCHHGNGNMAMETWQWQDSNGNIATSTWQRQHANGNIAKATWQCQHDNGNIAPCCPMPFCPSHVAIVTLPLPCCHWHVVITMLPLPCFHCHVVIVMSFAIAMSMPMWENPLYFDICPAQPRIRKRAGEGRMDYLTNKSSAYFISCDDSVIELWAAKRSSNRVFIWGLKSGISEYCKTELWILTDLSEHPSIHIG